mmetsp:Transcript_20984/g.51547  ORF Transcript_20984/g.51547 Transcript_20984/m.51547 type:complete len:163 (-) Transcript_20984:1035-1523(-)
MHQMSWAQAATVTLCVALLASSAAVPIKQPSVAPGRQYGDSWADCGKGDTELLLRNVTVTPEPVKAGKDFTLTFDVENVESVIEKATFYTQVYLIGVPIYSEIDNLCDKHPCPLEKGRTTVQITTLLPSQAPPGWYSLHINGLDQDGAPTLCADIRFTLYPW